MFVFKEGNIVFGLSANMLTEKDQLPVIYYIMIKEFLKTEALSGKREGYLRLKASLTDCITLS